MRGRLRRMRPMAFSMPPFCQGAWGSQKKVSTPNLVFNVWCKANSVPLSKVMGLAHMIWQICQQTGDLTGNVCCRLVGEADDAHEPCGALVQGNDVLAVFGKGHEVGFPNVRLVCVHRRPQGVRRWNGDV